MTRTPPFTVTVATLDSHEDRFRRFRNIKHARAFARRVLGDAPSIGHRSAVSQDGVAQVWVDGTTIEDLLR